MNRSAHHCTLHTQGYTKSSFPGIGVSLAGRRVPFGDEAFPSLGRQVDEEDDSRSGRSYVLHLLDPGRSTLMYSRSAQHASQRPSVCAHRDGNRLIGAKHTTEFEGNLAAEPD